MLLRVIAEERGCSGGSISETDGRKSYNESVVTLAEAAQLHEILFLHEEPLVAPVTTSVATLKGKLSLDDTRASLTERLALVCGLIFRLASKIVFLVAVEPGPGAGCVGTVPPPLAEPYVKTYSSFRLIYID